MAVSQLDKGNVFRTLHQGPKAFVIANAWDAGSARILSGLGRVVFQAVIVLVNAQAGRQRRLPAIEVPEEFAPELRECAARASKHHRWLQGSASQIHGMWQSVCGSCPLECR